MLSSSEKCIKQCWMTCWPFKSLLNARVPGLRAYINIEICCWVVKCFSNFCIERDLQQQQQQSNICNNNYNNQILGTAIYIYIYISIRNKQKSPWIWIYERTSNSHPSPYQNFFLKKVNQTYPRLLRHIWTREFVSITFWRIWVLWCSLQISTSFWAT